MKKAVVFLTKNSIFALFFAIFCIFGGCIPTKQNIDSYDENINMTPRQITIANSMTTTEVVEEVKSAVVGISCALYNGYSVGSGVAVAPNGYILTNQHVISGARNVTVYFADKTDASANIVWQDSSIDLAVIKTSSDMPYLECGDDGDVTTGEDVIAIGTPLALDFTHTVTKGIVSALNRTLQVESSNGNVSYMQNLIQHDASINPGNSGGPLINSRGQVIGINTLKATEAEGLGFAIPIVVGKSVLQNLSINPEWTSAYMGVFGFDSAVAKFRGEKIDTNSGVYITNIDEKVEKSLGGLKTGDIIIEIDGHNIKNTLDLRTTLYKHKCGDNLSVKIIRNGEELTLNCTLCERA